MDEEIPTNECVAPGLTGMIWTDFKPRLADLFCLAGATHHLLDQEHMQFSRSVHADR
jgi:hypothetical protein